MSRKMVDFPIVQPDPGTLPPQLGYDVAGSAESIGEGEAPTRQALRVMKEQNLSHVDAA